MLFNNYHLLNNSFSEIAVVFFLVLMIALFRKVLSRYVASLLYIPINKQWKSVEKHDFIALIIKPLGWFISVFIAVFAVDHLVFPEAWKFKIYGLSFNVILHRIGICLIVLFFFWVILSFINFVALVLDINAKATRDKRDDQVIVFFRDFFKVIVCIIGVLSILKIGFNADIGSLLTGLSIVGAALALAAKESIENLIASFIIFFDKPFYTGDTVKVNNFSGTIEHIGLRSTRIRTNDQTLITVPNKQMVDGVVDNLTNRNGRRAEWKLELSHENSLDAINKFTSAVKDFLVSTDTSVVSQSNIHLTDINKNGIILLIEIHFGMTDIKIFNEEKQKLLMQIKQRMEVFNLKTARGSQEITIISEGRIGSPTTE